MLKEHLKDEVESKEEIAVDGFDHVEFYVGNALQASYYYQRAFGFELVAFRGMETGSKESVSYVLKQDHVYLVLTAALNPHTEIAAHVHKHGDGVKAIGLRTRDARKAYETAIARGAEPSGEFEELEGEDGILRRGSVKTYGEVVHTFIERENYKGHFLPGYVVCKSNSSLTASLASPAGLAAIDHVVGNVEVDKMDDWVNFYRKVFGFRVSKQFEQGEVMTKYSGLLSSVMSNKSGNVKLPINEPANGLRRSQIQEYLDYYLASGVQHIAIATRNIIATVAELEKRGVEFLHIPPLYYDKLPERVGKIDEDINELKKLGILVDRESDGYLLQIFTKPVEDRPTLFFEVIQRKGATGFGKGNFLALYESYEEDQALRGNL
jgi:4-hydroxyphenylpyruvate dioxygenase